LGVHRRVVRQALQSAWPPERRRPLRSCPRLAPVRPLIDAMLEQDRQAPRKQRHTAHRIYTRLRVESPQWPMIELLQLGRQHGYDRLTRAIHRALTRGAYDAAAVRYFLTAPPLAPPPVLSLSLTDLTPSDYVTRPLPCLDGYDHLLAPAAPATLETVS
jgi:hypothetical protein